ncbi:MAG: nitroreductase/quinone reductase family protein [Dehalococcoidia bacterium]|nr:nitroreductase/quinone reductase family protein [Dehalococcoidia bacterium]
MAIYHKPGGLTRAMNSVLGWFASLGLTPGQMITLELKGRRSGKVRSTVVNSVEYGGQRYLVSPRGESEWVRNVRSAGGLAVIRHGKRAGVRLEEVPAGERAAIIQAYLKRNAMATKAHFGIEPDAPLPEFERIAALHPVFRIAAL